MYVKPTKREGQKKQFPDSGITAILKQADVGTYKDDGVSADKQQPVIFLN